MLIDLSLQFLINLIDLRVSDLKQNVAFLNKSFSHNHSIPKKLFSCKKKMNLHPLTALNFVIWICSQVKVQRVPQGQGYQAQGRTPTPNSRTVAHSSHVLTQLRLPL
jgi:hypothetical protein